MSTTPTAPHENGSLPVSEAAPKSPGILKPMRSLGQHDEHQSTSLDAATPLTARQKLFAQEYLLDLNGTQAAIRAGYSARTAKAAASRLLRNVKVAAEIRRGTNERARRLEISGDKVLQELAKLAFANISDFLVIHKDGSAHIDLSKSDRDQRAGIRKYVVDEWDEGPADNLRKVRRTRLELVDKGANLERLGKHLGLFKEKSESEAEVKIRNIYAEIDAFFESLPQEEADQLLARLDEDLQRQLPPGESEQ